MMTAVAELTPSAAAARDTGRRQGSVFFSFIHGADVRAVFMSSVVALLTGENAQLLGSFYDVPSGPNLAVARNSVADAFMHSKQDWLWCVDSDTAFGPDVLPRMLDLADPEKVPVLAAAVPVTAHDPFVHEPGELPRLTWAAYTDHKGQLIPWSCDHPLQLPLQRVDAVGTGCLLIHRRAFEATGPAPFAEETDNGISYGEDLSFCRKLARAGVPVHIAGGVRVGHAKVVTL